MGTCRSKAQNQVSSPQPPRKLSQPLQGKASRGGGPHVEAAGTRRKENTEGFAVRAEALARNPCPDGHFSKPRARAERLPRRPYAGAVEAADAAAGVLLAINSLVSSVVECMNGCPRRRRRGRADVAPTHNSLEVRGHQVVLRISHSAAVPVDVALPEPVREIQMEYADGQAMYAADTRPACEGAS